MAFRTRQASSKICMDRKKEEARIARKSLEKKNNGTGLAFSILRHINQTNRKFSETELKVHK